MLKYLFECEFADGSILVQTPEDVSAIDSKRSQFYDCLEKDKKSPITRFALKGDGKHLLVDLLDGHFELNDIPFNCHENLPEKKPIRRLIFYRQHTHSLNPETLENLSHEVEYCIGWQTTIKRKNYKETVTIK